MGGVWRPVKLGAGGFLTGLDIGPDDTIVHRTDTFGAYIWDTNYWKQLLSVASMPAADAGLDIGNGVYEIVIAPSNTNRLYMAHNGRVFVTDNKGLKWRRTSFAQVAMDPNDQEAQSGVYPRIMGRKMAVDPRNRDVCLIGTEADGLFITRNAGETWALVGDVPVSDTVGGVIVAFDPSSSVVGGRTQGIYASSYGNGVYRSTDGGASWSLTTSSPTTHSHMIVGPTGVVWLCDSEHFGQSGQQNLRKYSGGSWSASTAGNRCHSIAIDPANAAHIVVLHDSGEISESVDTGVTWSGGIGTGTNRVASSIPWHLWTNEGYMTAGDFMFYRTQSNKLGFAQGISYWHGSPNGSGDIDWTSQGEGNEQLIINQVVWPPGGKAVAVSWDRPLFRVDDPEVYPSTHGPNTEFSIAWAADYASSDPTFLVAIIKFAGTERSSYSTNGGVSWTALPSVPDFVGTGGLNAGGCIAASTPLNFVWVGSNNSDPYYTLDGGTTWHQILLSGVRPADPPQGGGSDHTGWGWAYYLKRHIVTADRVNANTFYIYNYGSVGFEGGAGTWRSTNGGVNWTQMDTTVFPHSLFNAKMKSVPGQAGHLFFTSGQLDGTNPADNPMYRSTNGGDTWSAVSNVKEVYDVTFGAPAPGELYPAVYIDGFVSDVYGVWRSNDNCSTWENIGTFPHGWSDGVSSLVADMSNYGNAIVGYGGSGCSYRTEAMQYGMLL